jgi:ribonuclease HII
MARKPDSLDLFPVATVPDFSRETAILRRGGVVCGVDEAGRGPWAGPVSVAAVILDPDRIPDGLNDSKKLTAERREVLAEEIVAGHQVALVFAAAQRIDATNIRAATLWAMREAVLALTSSVTHALIDGRDVPPGLPCPGEALIKGDGRSLSIAAASIIAKVFRDRHMEAMGRLYPGYGFERHMGYGTAAHTAALARLGPCPIHRMTFAPVKSALASPR